MTAVLLPLGRGLRALYRDWRSGELGLLALALLVAVAAVSSVAFLTDRVGRALDRDAAQMLGGDLAVQSEEPFAPALFRRARELGLATAQTVEFPSMVAHKDSTQLVSVKAVTKGYPLRGELQLQDFAQPSNRQVAPGIPPQGSVWADPSVLGLLDIIPGATLELGDAELTLDATLTHEPDRSLRFVNVAPRLLMNWDDVAHTGLLAPGARVSYRLLLAGASEHVAQYREWLQTVLTTGQNIVTLDNSRPELQRTLDRGRQFLSLVTLLTVLLAGVALALGTRRYTLRHQDGIAIMRCLGASRRWLGSTLLSEFFILATLAAVLGVAVAYALQLGLVALAQVWLGLALPGASGTPVVKGFLTAYLLLFGFGLPALISLHRVAPLRVLRRDHQGLAPYRRRALLYGLICAVLLVQLLAPDQRLGVLIASGFTVAFGVFALVAALVVQLANSLRLRLHQHPVLRLALAGISRRKALSVTQVGALAMGLTILLLLAITRTDLLHGWQRTIPPDAPNAFLINIQTDQRQAVHEQLRAAGLEQVALYPLVRARLTGINGRPVADIDFSAERAQAMVNREFNLSWRDTLPSSNHIVKGQWLNPDAAQASIEARFANSLSLDVGDTLQFNIAGEEREVVIASLREVKWDSFEVNFFALLSRSALEDAPASYISAVRLPQEAGPLLRELLQSFPNITVFDIQAILTQLQAVLDQVIIAVQLLFLFSVMAGVIVLLAAFLATRDERMHEAAILRTLGARADQLSGSLHIELALLGSVSGLLAAAAAQIMAQLLAYYVFDFPLSWSWWPWFVGVLAGLGLAMSSGRYALSRVIRVAPMTSLRELQ